MNKYNKMDRRDHSNISSSPAGKILLDQQTVITVSEVSTDKNPRFLSLLQAAS
jgi:hypothetical protein